MYILVEILAMADDCRCHELESNIQIHSVPTYASQLLVLIKLETTYLSLVSQSHAGASGCRASSSDSTGQTVGQVSYRGGWRRGGVFGGNRVLPVICSRPWLYGRVRGDHPLGFSFNHDIITIAAFLMVLLE